MKYYNFNLFHMVNRGFIAQTGDPTGSGEGGESIWGAIDGPEKRYFEAELNPRIKHTMAGLISFVGDKNNMLGSQFFITLSPDLTYLDAQHCVFGEVVEGLDILHLLNEAICDNDHRPYQDVRITHTVVLEDPFSDPPGFVAPDSSPEPTAERLKGGRIAPDEDIDETAGKSAQEIAEMVADREAKARATILEMVGDIPDAEMAPPENVLFVCKLNPVTNDDDLEIIFSRFGKIKSCEVIRDKKTGDSLQYAFVEFEEQKSCEDAYFKMDNVLIDDRRIHVDFSQSVAKVRWHGKGRITYYDDSGERGDPKTDFGSGKYQKNSKFKNRNVDTKRYKDNDSYRKYDKEKIDRDEQEKRNKKYEEKFETNRTNRSRSSDDYKYIEERDSDRKRRSNEEQKNGKYQSNDDRRKINYDQREENISSSYKRDRRSRSKEQNTRNRSGSREKKRRSDSEDYNKRRTESSFREYNRRGFNSKDNFRRFDSRDNTRNFNFRRNDFRDNRRRLDSRDSFRRFNTRDNSGTFSSRENFKRYDSRENFNRYESKDNFRKIDSRAYYSKYSQIKTERSRSRDNYSKTKKYDDGETSKRRDFEKDDYTYKKRSENKSDKEKRRRDQNTDSSESEVEVKKKKNKKTRKDDSSSSSSEEEIKKKKKEKQRKRKNSTSSESSSSSTSSSSSSDYKTKKTKKKKR